MLYKVNEDQWVNLRTVEVIMIKQGVNGKWYLEITTGTGSVFTDDFETREEARLKVLKIDNMIKQGANGKWYLEVTPSTGSVFTDDFETREEARLKFLKIDKMMEDLIV